MAGSTADVDAGWAALRAGEWETAGRRFASGRAAGAGPEADEGLAWVGWYREDGRGALAGFERAYRGFRAAGEPRGAARAATWLAVSLLEFRGAVAVAEGWLERARRLLDGLGPCAEAGMLGLHRAAIALEGMGDTVTGRAVGAEVGALGRDLGHPDLEFIGRSVEGLALVLEGEVREGMRRLDESAAAAMAGELTAPVYTGWACCYVIYACESVREHERAAQWCGEVKLLAERIRLRYLFHVCRMHLAGAMMGFGAWAEAEQELAEPLAELAATRPGLAAEGVVRLAELRRRQGRLEEAAALFADAEGHPLALAGEAALALEAGLARDAADAIERMTRALPAGNRLALVAPLELLVRARLALGDAAGARTACAELARVAERCGTSHLRASARFGEGLVAAAEGATEAARIALEDAVGGFRRARSPYECVLARIELARVLVASGRKQAATRSALTAAGEAERLGAERERERAHAVLASLEPAPAAGGRLTPRERQVLELVAEGLNDAAIAARLVVSEHTVHRHVANIRTKLGVASRSAAVARAAAELRANSANRRPGRPLR